VTCTLWPRNRVAECKISEKGKIGIEDGSIGSVQSKKKRQGEKKTLKLHSNAQHQDKSNSKRTKQSNKKEH
jgi:hypothetical protein